LTTDDNDIEKLVEIAAQENSHAARRRLFRTIRRVEVFSPCKMDPHDGKKIESIPLARLSDGTHAMMLFTAKSHPHLSEHEHFAGGTFADALAAALKMPNLDWVILSNNAWQRVTIHKQQIAAILDDINSDGQGQNGSAVPSEDDRTGKMIEDSITRAAQKSEELSPPIGSLLQGRELFLELAAGQGEDGQPIMKTFRVEHLSHVIRAYTTRIRPGITYGGIRWEELKNMIKIAPGMGGVQIMNDADDWVVFDRESLGFEAGTESQ